jgi:hypothetical protein
MAETTHHTGPNTLNLSTEAVAGGGAATIASKVTWPVQDAVHLLHSADAVRTGATAHHGFTSLGGAFASNMGGFLGIAAGTGISAYLNHLVFGHHEKNLTERYRPQLASILGKDQKAVTVDDLYAVSRENPSLDEELDRNRGMRNLRTGATLIATTLAFAAVFAAISFFPPLAALGAAAATGGLFSGAGLAFIASSMAISFATLHTSGKGLLNVGKKLFGYDEPTVEDHVHGLDNLVKEGKALTPEKVMGVYVAASPKLQTQIENTYGARYDTLSHAQQVDAEQRFGSDLPLESLAAAINNGEVSARELMFAVHGQYSGAGAVPSFVPSNAAVEPIPPAMQQQPEIAIASPEQPAEVATAKPITAGEWRTLVENQRAELVAYRAIR